jgi:hypothetical protein
VTGRRDDYQQNWRTVTALDAHTDGQGSAGDGRGIGRVDVSLDEGRI